MGIDFQIKGPDAAAHGMGIQIQGKRAAGGLYDSRHKGVEILYIVGKAVYVNHVGVVGLPEGAAMSPVVGQINLVTCFYKIVNDFLIFFGGFRIAVADHHRALGILWPIGLIVKAAPARQDLHIAACADGGQIGNHLFVHNFLKPGIRDNGDLCLTG